MKPTTYTVARKYCVLHNSATKRNKSFDLTMQDVRNLLSRKTCAYTGVALTDEFVETGESVPPTKRTIDRIDNTKGYVRGNVVAVSHAANTMKNLVLEQQDSGCYLGFDKVQLFVKNLNKHLGG